MLSRYALNKVVSLGLGPRGTRYAPGSLRFLGTATSSTRQRLLPEGEHPSPARSKDNMLYCDTIPIDTKEEIMDRIYCKIADRYDITVEITTFGLNKPLKRKFVRLMHPSSGLKMLDVAGGTGQIARHYLEYQDTVNNDISSSVHVVDLNEQMLRVGKHRFALTQWASDGRISFAQGSAENLVDIADNSYDIYSISAGMHNIPHMELALSEAYRVLKPGGLFACLDYGRVETPIIKQINSWHIKTFAPAIGQLLVGDRPSYERLVRSVMSFPHQRDFVKAISQAGFILPPGKGYKSMLWDNMVAFYGTKPE